LTLSCELRIFAVMNKLLLRRIGNTIRNYRHNAGWSQEELAEYADVHRNYVSRVESGLIDLSVSGLAKFAKGLRISPCDLLEEKPKSK
jgi:transcriptional regulator with XRE-family HTH domain